MTVRAHRRRQARYALYLVRSENRPLHPGSRLQNNPRPRLSSAKVETVKDGFDGPVSLVQVGDVAYVLDDPLRYLFDPELSKKPGPPVRAIPVKLPAAK